MKISMQDGASHCGERKGPEVFRQVFKLLLLQFKSPTAIESDLIKMGNKNTNNDIEIENSIKRAVYVPTN